MAALGNALGRDVLRRAKRARLKLNVRFTPDGGAAQVTSTAVTLKR